MSIWIFLALKHISILKWLGRQAWKDAQFPKKKTLLNTTIVFCIGFQYSQYGLVISFSFRIIYYSSYHHFSLYNLLLVSLDQLHEKGNMTKSGNLWRHFVKNSWSSGEIVSAKESELLTLSSCLDDDDLVFPSYTPRLLLNTQLWKYELASHINSLSPAY